MPGFGELKTGTLQDVVSYFDSLRGSDAQSEAQRLAGLDFSLGESRSYYDTLTQKLVDGSWTARQALNQLLTLRGFAIHEELFIQETQPLYEALTDIVRLQQEAERIKAYTSGATATTPDTPIKPVPANEIEAQTLAYRLAVYFASQRTEGTNLATDIAQITDRIRI